MSCSGYRGVGHPGAALTSQAGPAPAAGRWRSRGIGGGGALFTPAISPHDNHLVYMATDMSSVFKSGDFGRNWTTVDFRQLQGGTKSDICFTSDPDILYANSLRCQRRRYRPVPEHRWRPDLACDSGPHRQRGLHFVCRPHHHQPPVLSPAIKTSIFPMIAGLLSLSSIMSATIDPDGPPDGWGLLGRR